MIQICIVAFNNLLTKRKKAQILNVVELHSRDAASVAAGNFAASSRASVLLQSETFCRKFKNKSFEKQT